MKKIAVFSSNIYEPMVRDIEAGINNAAIDLGVKVLYFASFSDTFSSKIYDQYQKYDEGDTVVFELPDINDFDGAIKIDLSYGTYSKKRLLERLNEADIPVINVSGVDDRFFNIIDDEKGSFREIVEHIIDVHGCRNIYHVAGRSDKFFTQERIDAYREALESRGIGYDEEKVFYGNLWRDCGEAAVDYIIGHCRKNGNKLPDGIVCANDYMAIGVINALRDRGIRIPEDVIVTGYDGVEAAFLGNPSITTSRQPFYESGYDAVRNLIKYWNGEELPHNTLIKSKLICNESCGCKKNDGRNIDDVREIYLDRIGKISYLAQSTTNLILGIANANTIDECFFEIANNSKKDTGFRDMLLCLAPDWNRRRIVDSNFPYTDEEMTVVSGFMGDQPFPKTTFRKKDLLPPQLLEDPNPYYIFAIHHLQFYMGYLIVSPNVKQYDQLAMKSWIVNLSSMIENWRIREELNATVERMENLYNKDMLTSLYNRHGYDMFFEQFYSESLSRGTNIAVLMIDMDDLKYVNDNFGHVEGDYSLCTIAEGMKIAAEDGEICLRTGGDEFVVLAIDYSEEKVEEYSRRLREHIRSRIEADQKPYDLEVSIGACIKIPSSSDIASVHEISEQCMKQADTKMYIQKKQHKAAKGANED